MRSLENTDNLIHDDLSSFLKENNFNPPTWFNDTSNPVFISILDMYIPKKKERLHSFLDMTPLVSVFSMGDRLSTGIVNNQLSSSEQTVEWEIRIVLRTYRMLEKSIKRTMKAYNHLASLSMDDDFINASDIVYESIRKEMERRASEIVSFHYTEPLLMNTVLEF